MAKTTMSMKKPSSIKAETVQPIAEQKQKIEKPRKSSKRVTFTVSEEQHTLLKSHCSQNAISVRDFMIELLEKEVFRGR